jgi:hypothetical protein
MTIVLIVMCIFTPLNLSFMWHKQGLGPKIINHTIDLFYFIDVFVIFNSAYLENDIYLVVNRKSIAKRYLKGWFVIDIISIIPFNEMVKDN